MNNALYVILGLIIIVGLAAVIFTREPIEQNGVDDEIIFEDNGNNGRSYFEERVVELGVENIGQPIEGFDADLLMMAFPGLVPEDFDGVETLEGEYEVEDSVVTFVRGESQMITSAERALSSPGYATLHQNVSNRLNLPQLDEQSIDVLLAIIDTAEQLEAGIDEEASAFGVTITPLEVLEDSRCPIDVTCIQAGTVRLRATLQSGLGIADQVFTLDEPITTEAEEVTLVRVEPNAEEGSEISEGDYTFYFKVVKR